MSHFSTETVYTFSSYPSLIEAWQTTIVSDAASHPFLLHGMLAVSALHLASKDKVHRPSPHPNVPSRSQGLPHKFTHDELMRAFVYHQDQAVPTYRSMLQHALDLDQHEAFTVRSRQPWPAGPVYAMAVLTAFIATANISDNALSSEGPDQDGRRSGEVGEQLHRQTSSPRSSSRHLPAEKSSTELTHLETIFSDLLTLFIATRGTRVIVKAGLEMDAFQSSAYRHLITSSTAADGIQYPLDMPFLENIKTWYATLRTEMLNEVLGCEGAGDRMRGADANRSQERLVCIGALMCLANVHSDATRLMEAKEERLWHLRARWQTPQPLIYDFVWLFKWTAVVSQEYLALVQERRPAALVVLAQFVAICSHFEEQWYLEGWVRNVMAAIEHVLRRADIDPEARHIARAKKWVGVIQDRYIGT